MEVINWKLASHPLNWIVVFLMVFIFTIFAHFVITYNLSPKLKAA